MSNKKYNLKELLKKAEPQVMIRWFPKGLNRYNKEGKLLMTDDELEYLNESYITKQWIDFLNTFMKIQKKY